MHRFDFYTLTELTDPLEMDVWHCWHVLTCAELHYKSGQTLFWMGNPLSLSLSRIWIKNSFFLQSLTYRWRVVPRTTLTGLSHYWCFVGSIDQATYRTTRNHLSTTALSAFDFHPPHSNATRGIFVVGHYMHGPKTVAKKYKYL